MCRRCPSQIANILATIRYLESRGNYFAPPNKGRASGAYQFIASTWDGYGGYPHAYLAPPEIQDERAASRCHPVARPVEQRRLDDPGHVVLPARRDRQSRSWTSFRSRRPATCSRCASTSSAGWASGRSCRANPSPVSSRSARPSAAWACHRPPERQPADPAVDRKASIAFPVIGPSRLAAPDCGDAQDVALDAGTTAGATPEENEAAGLCADEAPGIVFGVKLQPVLSVADGVVTDVHNEPGETISVTVTDLSGRSYTLAGFNDDNPGTNDGAAPTHLRLSPLARVGTGVRAGQILGLHGRLQPPAAGHPRPTYPPMPPSQIPTDSVAPHIRLTIEDLDGAPVDAYGPVIDALFRQACSVGIGPWSSPTDRRTPRPGHDRDHRRQPRHRLASGSSPRPARSPQLDGRR